MQNEYIITFEENGEEKTITRIESSEALKARIEWFKKNNIKIKRILKRVVITRYIEYLDY